MSQVEVKRKQRTQRQTDLHRLKREKDKFAKYVKWIKPEALNNLYHGEADIFIRAFKTFTDGTKTDKFEAFWAYAGNAMKDEVSETDIAKRADCERRWREDWDNYKELKVEEFPLVHRLVKRYMEDNQVFVDPLINDLFMASLWKLVVPADVQDEVEFKNTAGDGYIFDPLTALWRTVDVKQMQIHLLHTMNAYIKEKNIVQFSTDKQRNYWDTKIGDASTYQGLLNILKGKRRYPNLFEQQLDNQEWLIPCANCKVYDARKGKLRARTKEDAFTQEACFTFLQEFVQEDDIVINDFKIREEFHQHLCGATLDQVKVVGYLQALCPNAMKLIMDTFKDDDRLWFILLRLGAVLSGFCTREILFVYGKGKGGKSTLFQTIVECVGDLGVVLPKASFLKNKFETGSSHKTDLKRASGRRVCLVDELESADIINETLIKNWASHQKIPMREIYGRQGEEVLRSFLVMITNEPPRFSQEDPTIRERVRAIKGTTKYFDKDCAPSERPMNYEEGSDWKDSYVAEEDTYWCYRTPEKEEFSRSFRTVAERKNELGTLLCLLCSLLFKVTKNGRSTQLPNPKIAQADALQFFQESDVVATFIDEYYQDEKDYGAAASLKDVYEKFRQTFPELGIRNFTLQTFKRSLGGKNLLFQTNKHTTIKLKKSLKTSGQNVYYT